MNCEWITFLLALNPTASPSGPADTEDLAAHLEAARTGEEVLRQQFGQALLTAKQVVIARTLPRLAPTDVWIVPVLEKLALTRWEEVVPRVPSPVPEALAEVLFDAFPSHAIEIARRVVSVDASASRAAFSRHLEASGLGTAKTRITLANICREVQAEQPGIRNAMPRWGFHFVTRPRQNKVLVSHVCSDSAAAAAGLEASQEIVEFAGVRGAAEIRKEVLLNQGTQVTLELVPGPKGGTPRRQVTLRRERAKGSSKHGSESGPPRSSPGP